MQIFRYLAGTLELEITFKSNVTGKLVGYTDSDWAGLKDGQRSTNGYAFLFSGGLVSYQSKQQATVALSSTEAEHMATTEAGKEALWIGQFLAALGYRLPGLPVSLKADNRGAILLTANPEFHRRTNHIEVQHHWIREKGESKKIAITYISTKEIVADGLTKALDPEPFKAFRAMIGMYLTGSQNMTEWEWWKCSHIVPARECISAPSLVFRLLSHTFQLCSLSNIFSVSYIPLLIYFLSHIFQVSFILCFMSFASYFVRCLICFMSRLRLCLNSQAAQAAQAVFQHLGRVSNHVSIQVTSRNQFYVTMTEIWDSWRNKMYIERADILYSVELLG